MQTSHHNCESNKLNGLKWTKVNQNRPNGLNLSEWAKVDQSEPNELK